MRQRLMVFAKGKWHWVEDDEIRRRWVRRMLHASHAMDQNGQFIALVAWELNVAYYDGDSVEEVKGRYWKPRIDLALEEM